MYVLSWRTVSAPTRVLFLCLFPSLLRNPGNKHKNNPLVSAEVVRHSITYIILYFLFTTLVKWHVDLCYLGQCVTDDNSTLLLHCWNIEN